MVFLAPYFIELLMFYCKMYSMFHVNDGPEGIFLCTETIKLYCRSARRLRSTRWCFCGGQVEFFHYEGGQRSYEKLSLGSHEFLEPDGWLTFGQQQVRFKCLQRNRLVKSVTDVNSVSVLIYFGIHSTPV